MLNKESGLSKIDFKESHPSPKPLKNLGSLKPKQVLCTTSDIVVILTHSGKILIVKSIEEQEVRTGISSIISCHASTWS